MLFCIDFGALNKVVPFVSPLILSCTYLCCFFVSISFRVVSKPLKKPSQTSFKASSQCFGSMFNHLQIKTSQLTLFELLSELVQKLLSP